MEKVRRRKRNVVDHPYPGLRPFSSRESLIFFGRDQQVDELINRMRGNHFMAVLGASGSGKSSLVRAGLMPALDAGRMAGACSHWRLAVMRPGDRPVHHLCEALSKMQESAPESNGMMDAKSMLKTILTSSGFGLKEAALGPILKEGENLLLVVDQFEELFRFQTPGVSLEFKEEARSFVRLLLQATSDPDLPIYVIITMRSDFLGDCPQFRGLPEAINKGQYLVPRLTRNQLREAITGPAAVFHRKFAPELIIQILNDIGDDPDQLPILQHALMRTYDHHGDAKELTLRGYEEMGGLKNAMNQHAEEVFKGLEERGFGEVTTQVFKNLTTMEGKGRGIRRPTRLSELIKASDSSLEEIEQVINPFRARGCSFLMPPPVQELSPGTLVDISHESVMRVWKRLVTWVEEEFESADFLQKLSDTARKYQEGKTGLLRDPDLQLALNWEERFKPTETWARRYDPHYDRTLSFLRTSQRRATEEKEYKILKQKQELRRTRIFAGILGVSAIFSIISLLLSLVQKAEADNQREFAEEKKIEAEINEEKAIDNERIAQLNAEEAKRQEKSALENAEEARRQEIKAIASKKNALSQKKIAVRNATEAINQKQLAEKAKEEAEKQRVLAEKSATLARKEKKNAEIQRIKAERLKEIANANVIAIQAPRYLGENDTLSARLADYAYSLLETNEAYVRIPSLFLALRKSLNTLAPGLGEHHLDLNESRVLAWSPRGNLAIGTGLGSVYLLLAGDKKPELLLPPDRHRNFRALQFSPNGNYLVAGDLNGNLYCWKNTADGLHQPRELQLSNTKISALQFLPGGEHLIVAGKDGIIRQVKIAGPILETIQEQSIGEALTSLAFSPPAQLLACGTAKGTLFLWEVQDGHLNGEARSFEVGDGISALSFDQHGNDLIAGTLNGSLNKISPAKDRINWHLKALPIGHNSQITSLTVTGNTLASAGTNGIVHLLDLKAPDKEPLSLNESGNSVWDIKFSPSGEFVAACTGKKIHLFRHDVDRIHELLVEKLSHSISDPDIEKYLPKEK